MLEYSLLLLGCALAYQSLQLILTDNINANLFIGHINRLVQANDLHRAVKICAASSAPLPRAVKQVLFNGQHLKTESAQKISDACQETFQEQAEIVRAQRAIALLELSVFAALLGLSLLFWRTPHQLWVLALFVLQLSVMLTSLWVRAAALKGITQHEKTLADALIALYQPAETPYR